MPIASTKPADTYYFNNREERLIRELDEKLELEQLIKFCQHIPIEQITLYEYIEQHSKLFANLLRDGILTQKQHNILFPTSRKTDFARFDASLLHVLIINFCLMPEPKCGWYNEPKHDDNTVSACYVRILMARQMIDGALQNGIISNDYHRIFNYIRPCLIQLGNEKEELRKFSVAIKYKMESAVRTFTGRQDEIHQLQRHLQHAKTNNQYGVLLTGEIGVGKTELVRKYCDLCLEQHENNVIWLNAETKHTLSRDVRDFALQLGLPVRDLSSKYLKTDTIINSIHQFLEFSEVTFVYDNLGLGSVVIKYLSTSRLHSNIIISKSVYYLENFSQFHLNVFTEEDAMKHIKKFSSSDNVEDQEKFVQCLNFHPYGMSIALAFVRETKTTLSEYLILMHKAFQENSPCNIPCNERSSFIPVYITLFITFQYIIKTRVNKIAYYILNVLSFLDGSRIHESLLFRIAKQQFLDPYDVVRILKLLERFYLLQRLPDNQVTIRCAVQDAIKTRKIRNNAVRPIYQQQILQSILEFIFNNPKEHNDHFHISCGKDWISHFLHLFITKDFYSLFIDSCIKNQEILFNIFSSKGYIEELTEIFEEMKCQFLGNQTENKHFFYIRIYLARINYELSDKVEKALQDLEITMKDLKESDDNVILIILQYHMTCCLYKQKKYHLASEVCDKILNTDSFCTTKRKIQDCVRYLKMKCELKQGKTIDEITLLKDLEGDMNAHPILQYKIKMRNAKYFHKHGMVTEALEKYREIEKDVQCIFGKSNTRHMKLQAKHAAALFALGEYTACLGYYQDILITQTFKLGEFHLKTIGTKHDISNCLMKLGKHKLVQRILQHNERIQQTVGNDNKLALIETKEFLGNCFNRLGNYKESIIKNKEKEKLLLEIFKEENDSEILRTRHDIASCLHDSGELLEAISLYKSIKTLQQELLGRENVNTLRTEHNLCVCLLDSGQESVALLRLKKLEKMQVQILGHYHSDLFKTQHNIAICLHKKKQFEIALEKYKQLENRLRDTLGDSHVDTTKVKHDLAVCFHEDSQFTNALMKYEEALETQCEILGRLHPDVLKTRYNIAVCHHDNKNLRKASFELEEIERLQIHVLGSDHPDVKRTQASLTICQREVQMWGMDKYCTIL